MTYKPVPAIEVHLWGRLLGAVALNPSSGWYGFRYDEAWVGNGPEVAPLHMSLASGVTYEFPELNPTTFLRLPALLADSLPDRFGNALVDAWMAEQGIPGEMTSPLDRLAYAADRSIGALEFRPPVRPNLDIAQSAVALADLVAAARTAITGSFDSDDGAREALRQLIAVGTSAGGARAKAVVAYNPKTSQIRTSIGELPEGFEHWLIKLDGVSSTGLDGHGSDLGTTAPHGRIEYAYHLMAQAARIAMSQCQLLAEGPRRHFMTRRFDRGPNGTRHHVISLCAVAHLDFNLLGTHSYDQYLQTVSKLGLGIDDLAEAYRRMVFNVVALNRDDHTKNFAFMLREHGEWELAPAFDITHTYAPDSYWNARHLMSVNGRFEDIRLSDLHEVGDRHDVRGFRQIVNEVVAAVERWPDFADMAGVPPDITAQISADHTKFRLLA